MSSKVSILFIKYLFIMIHSDLRLLCGIDTAIGTITGYLGDNALIGATVGDALDTINLEIISKRWLKLVPVKATNH